MRVRVQHVLHHDVRQLFFMCGNFESRAQAGCASAFEASVSVMLGHAGSEPMQKKTCDALKMMANDENGENSIWAGTAGAVEAVVAVMVRHAGSAEAQQPAYRALREMTHGNPMNTTRAWNAGAFEAVMVAMHGHADNGGVQESPGVGCCAT